MRKFLLAGMLGVACLGSGCGGGGGQSPGGGAQSANDAPLISGVPGPEATMNESYGFQPIASDADGDPLRYSIENKPGWAQFDLATGRLSGAPQTHDIGVYENIVITASDGRASASLPAFSIEVNEAARGSVTLSWQPPTENADGSPLTDLEGYRIYTGQDPDALSRVIELDNPGLTRYVVENLPAGLWHFAMTSVSTDGHESTRSAAVSKAVG